MILGVPHVGDGFESLLDLTNGSAFFFPPSYSSANQVLHRVPSLCGDGASGVLNGVASI
jgi:hypothetical protein